MRTTKERREKILDEFEGSGLSGKKFAALIGIKYQTFATWAQKRWRQRGATARIPIPQREISVKGTDPVRWLEAVVEQNRLAAGSTQNVLVVHLPGGARMEIADATQAALAALLLRSLENKPALSC